MVAETDCFQQEAVEATDLKIKKNKIKNIYYVWPYIATFHLICTLIMRFLRFKKCIKAYHLCVTMGPAYPLVDFFLKFMKNKAQKIFSSGSS